jgi:hypothetical protein
MIRGPDSPPATLPPVLRPLPGWARASASLRETDLGDSAFLASAGLSVLDGIVRLAAAWAGVWRQRLALSAAAASARMAGRREDEAALRDAWYLRRPDQDPGPAGRILGAWRRLTRARGVLELVGEVFGLPDGLPERLAGLSKPPLTAAAEAATLVMAGSDQEMLALMVADAVLAERLRWPVAVPLLAGQIAALKLGAVGRRPRPGDADWLRSANLAYARAAASACDLAAVIARRAETLQAVAPKLRAKGASRIGSMSDRASRRLFERLVRLGALRELSGRETFRLYGL